MAVDFRDVLSLGEEIGAFDVLLPFLLVFTLAFAVLDKSKILGKMKQLNVVVSFVIWGYTYAVLSVCAYSYVWIMVFSHFTFPSQVFFYFLYLKPEENRSW